MDNFIDRLKAMAHERRLYTLQSLPTHLARAGCSGGSEPARQQDRLVSLLTSIAFPEAKAEEGMVFDLLGDYVVALQSLPADRVDRALLEGLEGAIRRDIHFIARHPTTLFQCLWNSCWWYDCPEAAKHYDPPPEGWAACDRPWKTQDPKLHRLLETMRRDKEQASPGFSWVRSMRPPAAQLGTPLLAVLRGPGSGLQDVRFSPDGQQLASMEEGVVRLWDAEYGSELAVLEGDRIQTAFAKDECRVASVEHNLIRIRRARTGTDLALLHGHKGEVDRIWLSPDGRRLVSHSYVDQSVRLWDIEVGAELCVLERQKWKMQQLSFSSDGRTVAFTDEEGFSLFDKKNRIRLWDAHTGAELAALNGSMSNALFTADGSKLALIDPPGLLSGPGRVRLVDVRANIEQTRQLSSRYGLSYELRGFAFSPDGTAFASGGKKWNIFRPNWHAVVVWDCEQDTPRFELRGHKDTIVCVAFSPDGSRIASGSSDRTVRLWDAKTGARLTVLRGHHAEVESVLYSTDGQRVASSAGDTIYVWDVKTGDRVSTLRGHEGGVTAMRFSMDGRRIVSTSEDCTVRLWDVGRHAGSAILRGHRDRVTALSVTADGRHLVSRSGATTLSWDMETGTELARPKGNRLISRIGRKIGRSGEREKVAHVAWSADGHWMASSALDSEEIRVWKLEKSRLAALKEFSFWLDHRLARSEHKTLTGAGKGGWLLFSPDGRTIAAPFFSSVKLWDVATGEEKQRLSTRWGVQCIAFSADGRRIVAGSGEQYPRDDWDRYGTVQVWDVQSGAQLAYMHGHKQVVTAVSVSPDGSLIASGSKDRTVRVWAADTGAQLAVLSGHPDTVLSVSFSDDGRRIIARSNQAHISWETVSFQETERIISSNLETVIHFNNKAEPAYAFPTPLLHVSCTDGKRPTVFGSSANHVVLLRLEGT